MLLPKRIGVSKEVAYEGAVRGFTPCIVVAEEVSVPLIIGTIGEVLVVNQGV